jgi:glyoxylase-like metal-dependent hydrolase (beta-lactamase superfamily II)
VTTPAAAAAPIDGSGTERARCVLAPNPSIMTLDGTNTWLIAEPGSPAVIVADPGPDNEGHLGRVHDQVTQAGQWIALSVLTHGHSDHSAGAGRLAELTGAPVRAVDPAHRLGGEGLTAGGVLTDGGCELRIIATPGHTSDSVCLLLPADGALLTGDTVLGRGTTVIAGDGNLADYLGSLNTLRRLADAVDDDRRAGLSMLLPGHGPVLDNPVATLDYYLSHRAERLAEIRASLASGDRTIPDIVATVYVDVDKALWPFAEWSVRAQLDYLAASGELPAGMTY